MLLNRLEPPPLEPIPLAGEPPPAVAAAYSYRNYGKTPAFIVSIKARLIQIGKLDDLPPEPEYGGDASGLPNGTEVVAVPEKSTALMFARLEPNVLLKQDEIDKIMRGETALYVFGCVSYRDVFDEPRETRWGFIFRVPSGFSKYRGWIMAGPAAYNRHG